MFAFIILPSMAANGQMPSEQQLAVKYIKAVTDHDYNTLVNFYNRDSVFNDKTADKTYTGKRDILSFLKRAHQGVLEYDFNIEHMFNSDSLVVMIGNYHYKGPGEQFGKPGKIIDLAIPSVTTVTFDEDTNRVKEHLDLMDYQTMADQLAIQ
ncbi:nuclear transport factor 2 family protein [Shewanella sp. VB17]|uniref:nuclear transport factor 2 family protein n=1 Tax=Shewanella sp. VB17 TaxID=2739432 RepID=UPI0020B75F8B|nr:nuclear transport factor 2 family protein [Shewanella sp. VB17]